MNCNKAIKVDDKKQTKQMLQYKNVNGKQNRNKPRNKKNVVARLS